MRRSDLALRATRLLHGENRVLRAAEIAERLDSTPQFLPQVLKPLVKAGWLTSEPGPRGGYRLAVDPTSISILALIELVEGPTDDGTCVLRGGPCNTHGECSMHGAWSTARLALRERLDAIPVVATTHHRPRPSTKKGNS